jgi:endonuclease/exonuclease/phosphatase (EEP) superfamily protein YafD
MKTRMFFMRNTLFALTLLFTLSAHAQVESEMEEKGLSAWWFKTLPESQSLFTHGNAGKSELPKSFKALIWNIKKASLIGWQSEFLQYGVNKDLFLIQEAYESEKFESTTELISAQWDMGASFLYRKYGDAATGTAIGSVARPTEVFVKHSPDTEPVIATPKAITFAKYNIAGESDNLLVISVHAINFETTGAFKRQMDQIEEEILRHKGPVLLAGDFNSWNASRTSYLINMSDRLHMQEADYLHGDERMTFRGWFLDHIYTRGISVKKAEVIGESSGSDHKPFMVEMTVL